MATLTRTRPSLQVEDAESESRRPLHLDIPTPFPRILQRTVQLSDESNESSARTSASHSLEEGSRDSSKVNGDAVAEDVVTAKENANLVSGCNARCIGRS